MVFYYSINSAFKPWKEHLKIQTKNSFKPGKGIFKPWKVIKVTTLV